MTDDEFEQLKIASDRQGARCLSAFARKMILNVGTPGGENHADELAMLDRRISILEESMSRLFGALAGSSLNVQVAQK